ATPVPPLIFLARSPLCMNRAFPPMNVSSTSTSPDNLPPSCSSCNTRRKRCIINHALFCVIPSARLISYEETPFLALVMTHNATSHLSRPKGLSSKTELWRTLKDFRQLRHWNFLRVGR